MELLVLITIGFSSGGLIALALAGFLTSVGVITKMAVVTETEKYVSIYETSVLFGATTGLFFSFWKFDFYLDPLWLTALGLFSGIFVGVVAISLVEILNVFPVMKQRTKLTRGLQYLVIAIALGKAAGSLLYWLVPGFGR